MTRCSEFRTRMLESRYGLLDPAEVSAIRAHIASCKACAGAWSESGQQQKLIARAAKGIGPIVTFETPKSAVKSSPLNDFTRRSAFIWASVAAGLILAVGVLGIPAARDVAAHSRIRPILVAEKAKFESALANRNQAHAATRQSLVAAETDYKIARKSHDELVMSWASASSITRQQSRVKVTGPSRPLPGAPSEYLVSVDGTPFTATIRDDSDRVVHTQSYPSDKSNRERKVVLPPEAWIDLPSDGNLYLHVTRHDPLTGSVGDAEGPVRLMAPIYSTHLTTDKSIYRPGEAVYFRSLTLESSRLVPPTTDLASRYEIRSSNGVLVPNCELAGRSRPVIVNQNGDHESILGPDGQPIRGVGNGVFVLPTDLTPGEYSLAAYDALTDARHRTGVQPKASVAFAVVNPALTGKSPHQPPTPAQLALKFFPEGGDLVAGVPNRVYFRATDSAGRPAEVRGVVTNGTSTVCTIETDTDPEQSENHLGLGAFTITPDPRETYTVKLDNPPVVPVTGLRLPATKTDGVALSVRGDDLSATDPIKLSIWSAGEKRSLWVSAYVRGVPVAHSRATVEPNMNAEIIMQPTNDTIGGVTRVTVFEDVPDGADKPVAERLIYRRPVTSLKLGVTTNSGQGNNRFAPGETVRLNVSALTEDNQPTPAILHAAVVRRSVANPYRNTRQSVPAHFYLAHEVRGPEDIENADFLLSDHPKAGRSLDLVLGTQGWRRFAEQAPEQFRLRSTHAADRLLNSLGAGPVTWHHQTSNHDDVWQKYEAVHKRLREVRQNLSHIRTTLPSTESDAEYAATRAAFLNASNDFHAVSHPTRRLWRKVIAAGLLIAGLGLVVGARRGPTGVAGFACVFISVFLGVSLALTGSSPQGWRELVDSLPDGDSASAMPTVLLPSEEPGPTNPSTQQVASSTEDQPRVMKPLARSHPPRLDSIWLNEEMRYPANRVRIEPLTVQRPFSWTPEFAELARSPSTADFCGKLMELAETNVVRTPPLPVREYAHSRATVDPIDARDTTATLLWKPVLVVPESGSATLTFDLNDVETTYQVIVSGHTLDGRIGSVTGEIVVRGSRQK